MMPSAVIAGLLALAVLIAVVQLWRAARRHPVKPWRIIVLMVLSGISAVMLYFTLLPPTQRVPAGERIVQMVRYLHSRGVLTKVRNSAGQDIDGGCGQLRARAVELVNTSRLRRPKA